LSWRWITIHVGPDPDAGDAASRLPPRNTAASARIVALRIRVRMRTTTFRETDRALVADTRSPGLHPDLSRLQ
jgi:hypothetical protein